MLFFNFPEWDTHLFLYLNSKHNPLLDPVMKTISSYALWCITFVLVAIWMFRKSREWGKPAVIALFLGIGFNSLVNNLLKYIVQRPRPSQEEMFSNIIHVLGSTGVNSSFFSAHSSNSFCLAIFSALYFRKKGYTYAIFIWATLVAYSRIYVGKHYPLDVFCGILFGLLVGYMCYKLYDTYREKRFKE